MNHRLMRNTLLTIALATTLVSCSFSQRRNEGCSTNGQAKFAPESGKKLFIIGQDLGAVGGLASPHNNGYVDNFDGVPAGVTTYVSLNDLQALDQRVNYGSGDLHAAAYLEDGTFDNSCIVIGLYLVNQLKLILNGTLDDNIVQLANWIKEAARPVFLRAGYEFDLPQNNYQPE